MPLVRPAGSLRRRQPFSLVGKTLRSNDAIILQNPQITFIGNILETAVRRGIKHPSGSSVLAGLEGNGQLFHQPSWNQCLSIFSRHFQEITEAVQIQRLAAVMLLEAVHPPGHGCPAP